MSTDPLQPVAIFWDIENCAVPHGVNAEEVAVHIRQTFKAHLAIQGPIRVFSAYGDFAHLPRHTRQGCQKTGVSLIDIPHGKKDAADKAILADMFLFALDHPPPGTILLISGDVDFAPALHKLGQRGYCVVLAIPSGLKVSPALCNACQHLLSWPDVARGKGIAALRAPLTCINNDVKSYKRVVHKSTTDQVKSKDVPKDIMVGGAHHIERKMVLDQGSDYNRSEATTRIPDGIFEEQVKVPSHFAKELEEMAVAMGMNNLGIPLTSQGLHEDLPPAKSAPSPCKQTIPEHPSFPLTVKEKSKEMAVAMGMNNLGIHEKVAPLTLQSMHEDRPPAKRAPSPCKQTLPERPSLPLTVKENKKKTMLIEQSTKVKKKKMKKTKSESIAHTETSKLSKRERRAARSAAPGISMWPFVL